MSRRWSFGSRQSDIARAAAVIVLTLVLGSCGIRLGSSSPNDPIPNGPITDQGSWAGLNGQTVTGNVIVYLPAAGTYTFRLEGLSAPDETGLQLYATDSGGNSYYLGNLRASSGNQNYSISPGVQIWSQVTLYSATHSQNYGQVLF